MLLRKRNLMDLQENSIITIGWYKTRLVFVGLKSEVKHLFILTLTPF